MVDTWIASWRILENVKRICKRQQGINCLDGERPELVDVQVSSMRQEPEGVADSGMEVGWTEPRYSQMKR
jgi:hypothetical protein